MGEAGEAPPSARSPRPAFRDAAPVGAGEEVRGTVKWYNAEKGFGFIAPEGGGNDVFVHATALERSGTAALSEGQAVTMQVAQGKKGLEATTVRPA
ncbi:cold-shock protein [Roseomonas sp. CCTCC AB2023176]|uniref:cold-shock protein n=1 Tax=Roseomonas sp. CCTCC AB2023176 TaxID=3342640 RepID=UPI0035E35BDC